MRNRPGNGRIRPTDHAALNYEPRFQKPILYYWLTSATYLVTGRPKWRAVCGRRWRASVWCRNGGLWAALVRRGTGLLAGASSQRTSATSRRRMALPDCAAFCMTLAIWAAMVATSTGALAAQVRDTGGAWLGLGFR